MFSIPNWDSTQLPAQVSWTNTSCLVCLSLYAEIMIHLLRSFLFKHGFRLQMNIFEGTHPQDQPIKLN